MSHTHPGRLLALGAISFALVLTIAPAAAAHDVVIASNPPADSTVTQLPAEFSVTSSEPLLDLAGNASGFALQVTDAEGLHYGDGCLSVDGPIMAMGASLGDPGAYRVLWQFVSSDGHTASGEFAFTWAPAADAVISPGSPTPPVCGETVVEETPTPTPTPTPEPTVEPTEQPIDDEVASGSDPSAALWIGGAVVAVLVAGAATWLIIRRRA